MTSAIPASLDAETLRAATNGEPAAWRALVELYTDRLFGLLFAQCRDRELAEELTQLTFVKLVTVLQSDRGADYQERGRFEAWLFRVAMNGLRDEMRRRKRHAVGRGWVAGDEAADPVSEGLDQSSLGAGGLQPYRPTDPSATVEQRETCDRLREAVNQLSEADQEVLHLRHTAGLSFPEIAEALDQPLGTVLARSHRAVKKLRKIMAENE